MEGKLPELTRDLGAAKRDLDRFGYCLIREALDSASLRVARARLEEQAQAEIEAGLSYHDGGPPRVDAEGRFLRTDGPNQRLWMLANKGACFRELIVHPLVDALVGHVLGAQFILSTGSANIAKLGGARMGLHTDQWWMPQPVRPGDDPVRASEITRQAVDAFVHPDRSLGIAPAVVCNTLWMLSDFTAENGATELVPGSHLSGAHPDQRDQSHYPIVQPTAPAGTLLVFDGRLWHGTGAHRGGDNRLGVLMTFCAPQFRQQENQTLGIDPELWPALSEQLRVRLGFRPWNAYGRIESPLAAMIEPLPRRIGEMKPARADARCGDVRTD